MGYCPLCSDDEVCPGRHELVEAAPMQERISALESRLAAERARVAELNLTLAERQGALDDADRAVQVERARADAAEEQTKLMAGAHASMMISKVSALKLGVEFKERVETAEARVAALEAFVYEIATYAGADLPCRERARELMKGKIE